MSRFQIGNLYDRRDFFRCLNGGYGAQAIQVSHEKNQ